MYRAACHVHSDWSYDGRWALVDLASAFKSRGYDMILATEHDKGFSEKRRQQHRRACADASEDGMRIIPGIEYSDSRNEVHVLVWGDVPFLGEGLETRVLLDEVARHGGVAVLAHPSRKAAWRIFDPCWAGGLVGIELWNRKTDGWAPSGDARGLIKRTNLTPYFGLDFHDRRQFFPLAMNLELVGEVSESNVLSALRSRHVTGEVLGGKWLVAPGPVRRLALSSTELCRRTLARMLRRYRRKMGAERSHRNFSRGGAEGAEIGDQKS